MYWYFYSSKGSQTLLHHWYRDETAAIRSAFTRFPTYDTCYSSVSAVRQKIHVTTNTHVSIILFPIKRLALVFRWNCAFLNENIAVCQQLILFGSIYFFE